MYTYINLHVMTLLGWLHDILQRIAMYIVSQAICIPFVKKPFQHLTHPEGYGLENAMNIRIKIDDEDREEEIGCWFLQPLARKLKDDEPVENNLRNDALIKENEKVILYLHGNAETRAQYHRRELYKIFQKMGYHVLAIDYRGYGDSSKITPSQTTMVKDANAAFDWLKKNSHPSASIFIWGHSLGTGVTSKLSHDLTFPEGTFSRLSGIFLEAPFNRMLDEVKTFRLSRILPWIGIDIDETLSRADVSFDSTHWLKDVKTPILIMHAEDDNVIPFYLASQLYNDLSKAGANVEFHSFSSQERLGHDGIFKAKHPKFLSDIVSVFVEKVLKSELSGNLK